MELGVSLYIILKPIICLKTSRMPTENNFLDSTYTWLLLLDLYSAFDTLNHLVIIERIKDLAIEGSPLKWLTSFITNRTSSVKINDFISPPTHIHNGIVK